MQANKAMEERIVEALSKQDAMEPQRIELGGGLYYKCYWTACNTDINRFMNYCPGCGQKIKWGDK